MAAVCIPPAVRRQCPIQELHHLHPPHDPMWVRVSWEQGPTDAQTSVALGRAGFLVLGSHGAGISKSSHARFWSSQIPVSGFTGSRTLCSVSPFCGCHG